MITDIQASIEDLYHVTGECKAEIVDGNIVLMSPTGDMPARAGGAIYMSLRLNEHITLDLKLIYLIVSHLVQMLPFLLENLQA
jgi:hypothetical protein